MPIRMKSVASAAVILLSSLCGACAIFDPEARSDSGNLLLGAGTPVMAAAETIAVGTQRADAADDPEIWVDPRDPSRALILGTDKQAGLYTYQLDGKVRQFLPDGRLNNVDLRDAFPTPLGARVLVAASDRDRRGAALYLMDPATMTLSAWSLAKLDLGEPYGICVGRRDNDYLVIVIGIDGQVRQIKVRAGADGAAIVEEERRFAVSSQAEGCVVDDVKKVVYIGEEAKGVWRFSLQGGPGVMIAPAPSAQLQPDVEGLAILRDGAATWLMASSQGDSAFAVWRVDGDQPAYRGRFSIVPGNGVDAVTGTDGIAAQGGPVGPYASGLVVVQDDVDTDGEAATGRRARQNFKLIDWAVIKAALRLESSP